MCRLALALLLTVAHSGAPAGRPAVDYALSISGDGLTSAKMTLADLGNMDQVKASVREHDGSVAAYEGPTLFDVLKHTGLVLADHPGKAMSAYVAVVASDGYEVVFGLGEVAPAISRGRSFSPTG